MAKSGIDKLDDSTHYPDWAIQVEAVLEEKEVWDIVSGDEVAPMTGPNSKTFKSFVKRARLAKAQIILHLAPSQLPHIRNLATAKEMWDTLAQVHKARGFGTLIAMRRKFFSMFKGDATMQQWIAYVRDHSQRLEDAGLTVQPIDLIIALTTGLGEEYTPLIISLDSTPFDELSVEKVIARLLNEELRQTSNQDWATSTPSTPTALLSRHVKKAWTNPKLPMKTVHKASADTQSISGESHHSNKHGFSCYNCGGKGHRSRDCPSPKQRGERANMADADIVSVTSY